MRPIIIDDSNYREILQWHAEQGHGFGHLPRVSRVGELETSPGRCAPLLADKILLIDEKEWPERIKEMTAKKLWPQDKYEAASGKDSNQDGLEWCWAFSLTECVMYTRVCAGEKHVPLAAESLGGSVGYKNQGNSLDVALAYAIKHGICRADFIPALCRDPSKFKTGWEQDALNYRPIEDAVWDGGGQDLWAEFVTALLSGYPPYIAYNWAGHAMIGSKLILDPSGEICTYTPNTWGPGQAWTLKGKKKVPDELYIPRVITYCQN
jgi:hypothetical protein